MSRFGGMVSFRVARRRASTASRCASRTRVFTLGESLGGVESLIEHPGRMTHASVAGTELEVPADLVRLSVGIETAEDLLADLDQALGARAIRRGRDPLVCVDFGSTFTKALLVDLGTRAGARRRRAPDTTGADGGDVLDGYDACLAALARVDPRAADAEVLACSSAGGGLRIAVVGNEELVTAEAGRRVALSSGGKVVAVPRGRPGRRPARRARRAAPDVVLLTGRHRRRQRRGRSSRAAAAPGRRGVARAGGRGRQRRRARGGGRAILARRLPYVLADNVVPAHRGAGPEVGPRRDPRGVPRPRDRRQAAEQACPRANFTAHGARRHPGRGADRGRAAGAGSAATVVVVDVGGATTDVHSVVEVDPEEAGLAREVVAPTPVDPHRRGRPRDALVGGRAPSAEAGLRPTARGRAPATRRTRTPASCRAHRPSSTRTRRSPAPRCRWRCAGTPAASRVVLSPEGRVVERTGDRPARGRARGRLRRRAAARPRRRRRAGAGPSVRPPVAGWGWQLPEHAAGRGRPDYVLAAAGLLAAEHPDAAYRLVTSLLDAVADTIPTP